MTNDKVHLENSEKECENFYLKALHYCHFNFIKTNCTEPGADKQKRVILFNVIKLVNEMRAVRRAGKSITRADRWHFDLLFLINNDIATYIFYFKKKTFLQQKSLFRETRPKYMLQCYKPSSFSDLRIAHRFLSCYLEKSNECFHGQSINFYF